MKSPHDKIMARVKKMLTLAYDSGATEGERDNALRMAHKYLAKYNLDIAEVEASGEKKAVGEERIEDSASFYGRPWARSICQVIGDMLFCHYFYISAKKATNTRHCFIGRRSNATTASLISKFVVESILKEAKKQARKEGMGNAWVRTFCWGACGSIRQRVVELKVAEATVPSTGKSLVLANVRTIEANANQAMLQEKYPHMSRGRGGKGFDSGSSAHGQGRAYGHRVSLNTQIGN